MKPNLPLLHSPGPLALTYWGDSHTQETIQSCELSRLPPIEISPFAISDPMPSKRPRERASASRRSSTSSTLSEKLRFKFRRTGKNRPTSDSPGPIPVPGLPVEISNENYNEIVVKSKKDVVVEYYDQEVLSLYTISDKQCKDAKIVDEVCMELSKRYKDSSDTITIARCNVRNVKMHCVYDLPTIKLYPANAKWLPVEYVPNDYSRMEGYIDFIEQERSLRSPDPVIESMG